jgi:molecular chaperone GrpE
MDKHRKRSPIDSEDAYARGAGSGAQRGSSVGSDALDQSAADTAAEQTPTEQAPASEQGDGTRAPDTEADVAELSDRSHWQRQLQEQQEKYLRLAAEYDNFRKRSVRERQEAGWRAQADMARGLLEALDDLARFAHIDPSTVDAATVVQGAEMVERKALKSLAGHGLEVVDPLNHPFDPKLHEAIATEPALAPEDDDLVGAVYQRGYVFNGHLLRPARVVVKQWNG